MFASRISALRSISRSSFMVFSRITRGHIKLLWQALLAVALATGSVPTFAELCPSSLPPTQKWVSFNPFVVGYGDTPLEACRLYYGDPTPCSSGSSRYCGGTDHVTPVKNGLGAQYWCINWSFYNDQSTSPRLEVGYEFISQRVNLCPAEYRIPYEKGVQYWDFYNVRNGVTPYCAPKSCIPGYFLALPDKEINEVNSCPAHTPNPGPNPYILHPVSVASGNKRLRQTDIVTAQPLSLGFTRYYNSFGDSEGQLGNHWTHTYSRSIELTTEPPLLYPAPAFLPQSANFGTPSQACTSGWSQIQSNTELAGKITTAMLTTDGRCRISSGGKVWRTLTIYNNDGVVYRQLGIPTLDVLKVHRADGRTVVFRKHNGA
jgi:hypothetical protein